VGIVKDVEATIEATQQVTEMLCFIQETLYGRMWSFTSDMARADTAYTSLALGAHTDTAYLSVPAGIQVFHCTQHDGDGGRTLLVDGFHAAERLRVEDPKAFETLCRYRIYHENNDRNAHYVRSLDPVLKVHPVSEDLEMIRYNHYDRAPISTICQTDVSQYYDALAALSSRVADPGAEFWMKLDPGIVIFIDNWRVLHGRSAFTGLRRICGCYLPRDDWMGKARVLGMIP
jgi:trimethyllysine dioxygenase